MHGSWNDEPRRRQHGGRRNDMGWGGAWGAGPMGPPPWLAQLLGQEMGGRRGRHGGGRPRVRRGDVRSAILDVLAGADEPVNGYQVIQQIAERTGGQWKPSPGSVYPTIQQLEDEGLVEDAPSGRKALQLTAEGRDWVADHAAELAALWKPFEAEEGAEDVNFKQVIGQTVGAIAQVMSSGTPDQRDKALGILADTRRRLYGLLADGPETDDVEGDDLDDELDGREGR